MIADLVGLLIAFPFVAALWACAYYGIKWLQRQDKYP